MAVGRTRVYVRWISQVWGGRGGLHSLMTFVKSRLCLKIQGGLAGLLISIRLIQDFYNGAKLKGTEQVWRDNSHRVRTHEKETGYAVHRLCTKSNNTKHVLGPIRSRHSLNRLEIVWWTSVPKGFSASA